MPISFSQKQRHVKRSIGLATVASALVAALALRWGPATRAVSLAERLAFGLCCDVWCAAVLALAIGAVTFRRLTSPDAIDGQTSPGGATEIDLRVLQNTLEQLVLAASAHLAFVVVAPRRFLQVLPVMVGFWVAARLLFFVGYHRGDNARAFGFAATFIPSVGFLVFDLWCIVFGVDRG
ncbi:MAG: MAPEG family protein [Polyangiales bacterium]